MNDILKIAIAEALKKQIKKEDIKPGEYIFDTTIRLKVSGNLTKLADREVRPTTSIPWLTTIALILERAGFQRERAKQLISEAMIEAISNKENAREQMEQRIKDVEGALIHVRAITNKLPKETCSGPTLVNVEIQEIQEELKRKNLND